jgi:hypothetical protein
MFAATPVPPRERGSDLLVHSPADVVGCVDFRPERQQDRVERKLGYHLRDALRDPRPADQNQLFRDDQSAGNDVPDLVERRSQDHEKRQRAERVCGRGRDGDADDAEFWQRAEAEGQADRREDVEGVDDAVDVHRRPGVAGPLDRSRGDEVDVDRGRRDHDHHEVGAPVVDDGRHRFLVGERSEDGDGVLVEQESEEDERDSAQ